MEDAGAGGCGDAERELVARNGVDGRHDALPVLVHAVDLGDGRKGRVAILVAQLWPKREPVTGGEFG